jgi:hypothetical protein
MYGRKPKKVPNPLTEAWLKRAVRDADGTLERMKYRRTLEAFQLGHPTPMDASWDEIHHLRSVEEETTEEALFKKRTRRAKAAGLRNPGAATWGEVLWAERKHRP